MNKDSKRLTIKDYVFYAAMAGLGITLTTIVFYKYKNYSNEEKLEYIDLTDLEATDEEILPYVSNEKITIKRILNENKMEIDETMYPDQEEENIKNLL